MNTEAASGNIELAHGKVVVLANARSGKRDAHDRLGQIRAALALHAGALDIRQIHKGADIADMTRQAVADGADVVAVFGGDGTQSAVAGALAGSDATMAVLPGGTFNYFARELGVGDSLENALKALLAGRPQARDLASVNDRVFINNASFGVYPEILERREAIYSRWGRSRIAAYWSVLLTLLDLRAPMRMKITVDGAERLYETPLAFVARSAFQLESLGLEGADAVRRGRFALFVAHGQGRRALIGASIRLALGRVSRHEDFDLIVAEDLTIETRSHRKLVAFDGEKAGMTAPFRLRVAPNALRVIVARPDAAGGGAA